ncbi:MAG: MFS transporter [Aeromonadales bacterium]|nr:MFS transporter [Aeromonadales bacterium]
MDNKKYIAALSCGHFATDINSGSLPAMLPFFVSEYGMSYTDVAGLMFASSFLSSLIQPLFGLMADRGSRQYFMGAGILLAAIPMALTGVFSSYWAIFACVTATGIGSAVFHPEAARNIHALAGRDQAKALSIFSMGGNGGFGLGPLLAVALVSAFGMKGTIFYGIFGLLTAAAVFSCCPGIMRAGATMERRDEKAGGRSHDRGKNDWKAFSKLFLVIVFRSSAITALTGFLPLYCISVLGASKAAGSATVSVLSITGIAATLAGGYLADRRGCVRTLRMSCALLVPCMAVLAFSGSFIALCAVLVPLSFAMHMAYSPIVVLGQSYLARNVGFASGVTLGISFSIGGVAAPSIGAFGDAFGLGAVMALVFVLATLCAAATWLLPSRAQRP